jgi:hypothetical protein
MKRKLKDVVAEISAYLKASEKAQYMETADAARLLRDTVDAYKAQFPPRRRVTLNKKEGLYVIPSSSGGYSCLGFKYADKILCAVRAWLMDYDARVNPTPGTIAHYRAYAFVMKRGAEHSAKTGERCPAELEPRLVGLEGKRVEVIHKGEARRFIVGKSTGWLPCHLEIHNRASRGGGAACIFPGDSIRVIEEGR